MDEVTIGVLALFGFLSIALTHGAKLARDSRGGSALGVKGRWAQP
ncbi:hypothetical protein [Streptomyces globisporus]